MAESGDNRSVDLQVKDIYGENCKNFNLNGEIIAASFGKLHRGAKNEDVGEKF